jgi:hypothetical protein
MTSIHSRFLFEPLPRMGSSVISPDDAAYLPNPQLTPGDVLDVTTSDICVPGYASKVRDVPNRSKIRSTRNTASPCTNPANMKGQPDQPGAEQLQFDLQPWLQSYTGPWNAHIKDKLENTLHNDVCTKKVDLKTA